MAEPAQSEHEVDQFLRDQILTVPHLEALLLLWRSSPIPWSVDYMAERLFVEFNAARAILEDLARRQFIVATSQGRESYRYRPEPNQDRLIASVDSAYRRELIRISRLIQSRQPARDREFVSAIGFRKGR